MQHTLRRQYESDHLHVLHAWPLSSMGWTGIPGWLVLRRGATQRSKQLRQQGLEQLHPGRLITLQHDLQHVPPKIAGLRPCQQCRPVNIMIFPLAWPAA